MTARTGRQRTGRTPRPIDDEAKRQMAAEYLAGASLHGLGHRYRIHERRVLRILVEQGVIIRARGVHASYPPPDLSRPGPLPAEDLQRLRRLVGVAS